MEGNLVCRLCLYNNEDILSIFGDRQREAKLQEKLMQYLNLEVKEDDTLPKLICLKCFQTVESFHVFYQEVSQNQTVFAYSTQPGMIVISDQNSHTTYILREEEVIGPSCIEIGDGSSVKLETLNAEAIQYRPSTSATQHQKLTLVQLPNHQVPTAMLRTVDSSEESILPGNEDAATSELPTYDESQKSKERHVLTSSQEDLEEQENMIVGNADQSDEGTGLAQSVEFIHTPVVDTKSFTLVQEARLEEYQENEGDEDDEDDETDEAEPEEQDVFIDALDIKPEFPIPIDLNAYPKKIIHENRLVVRGKNLSTMMAKFYGSTCELCVDTNEDGQEKFLDMESYLTHFKEIHAIKGHVWCCGQKILKPRMMAMHMARHLQPEAFKCPECGKLMTTPKILQYHIQNHLPEEERPLKCDLCPRRFSYGSALMSHNQSHLPEEERTQHICDECGKSYSTSKKLGDHIQAVHSISCKADPLAYVCHICAKQFTSKSNLSYHLTTHQPKIHQVQCEQCKKWLKNRLCLRKHMVQHSMVRHKCNLCDYSAVNMQCLRNHMRVQHTDLKPFSCDECGKSFKLKNTLLNHQVQHTGLKKFSCEFCMRTFASSGNYYAHRKRMHPQELAVQKKRKEEEENEFRKNTLLVKLK